MPSDMCRFTTFAVATILLASGASMGDHAAPGEWPMWRRVPRLTGYQPMPGAIDRPKLTWQYDLAGREGLVLVRPGGRGSTLTLAAESMSSDTSAREMIERVLTAPSDDPGGRWTASETTAEQHARIGKLLPDAWGLQRAVVVREINQGGEETEQGSVSLFEHTSNAEVPTLIWQAPSVYKTHRPTVLLTDVDGDGDLDIAHSDWGTLAAYDGQSGKILAKLNWLDRRHRGVFIAKDIDGDSLPEFVVIGHFHMNVSVVDNDGNRFRVLWSRSYDEDLGVQDRIVRATRNCLADFDGDGSYELVYNLFDFTSDAVWHVMIHDALSGEVVADLPGRFLDEVVDLDGDGRFELILSESDSLALPDYRNLFVVSVVDGGVETRWQGHGRLHQRFDSRKPLHVADEAPYYDAVCGDVDGDGWPEFVVSDLTNDGSEQCVALGFDKSRKITPRLTVQWPSDVIGDVRAIGDLDGGGTNAMLVRLRVSAGRPVMAADASELELISWNRRFDPALVGSATVADLEGSGLLTILVPHRWERVAALRVPEAGGSPQLLWDRPGRPMRPIKEKDGHHGFAAYDLKGRGAKAVIMATDDRTGGTAVEAVDGTGQMLWQHPFRHIQWGWGRALRRGAVRTWSVGQFRKGHGLDVYISAHLNAQHSGTSYLLDGRNGSLVWERLYLKADRVAEVGPDHPSICCRNQWSDPMHVKEVGGGHASIADVDGDGLDEIAGGYCRHYWLLRGSNGHVMHFTPTGEFFKQVLPGSYVSSSTPILLDADRDGQTDVLIARQAVTTALMDLHGKQILWWRDFKDGFGGRVIIGLADVDGDGHSEVGSISRKGRERLICANLATGQIKWDLPLPELSSDVKPTDFATGDVDGDGVGEFVFGWGQTLYAVNGRDDQPNVVWKLELPARCGAPILADVDADGRSEILIVTEDGYLRCVDGPAESGS